VTTLYSTLLHTHTHTRTRARARTRTRTRTHTHTHTQCLSLSLVSTVTCSLLLLCNWFQRRTFRFLSVSELSLASATSFLQQQLTTTEPQQFSNSLTHQPTSSLHSTNSLTAWTNSLTVLHGPQKEHRPSLLLFNCCLRYMFVCEAVTQ
jgi:hypothetical protein